jgi:hypothetical protein
MLTDNTMEGVVRQFCYQIKMGERQTDSVASR